MPKTNYLPAKPIVSNSSDTFNTTSGSSTPVLDSLSNPLQSIITVNGQAVAVSLEADGTGDAQVIAYGVSGIIIQGTMEFYRNGTLICKQTFGNQNNISVHIITIPSSSFRFTDTPPIGTHTYTVKTYVAAGSGTIYVYSTVLQTMVIN